MYDGLFSLCLYQISYNQNHLGLPLNVYMFLKEANLTSV